VDSANFAVVSPRERAALVVVSRGMLAHPYHVRYELIEFAVYTLAARAQGLVSLHAACIGRNGRGVLLVGSSGTGKSTLALLCLMRGMELLAEDGVFVKPDTLRAIGLGSFLHLRADSLRFLPDAAARASIRKAPVIRRRSGVEKFELDVRRTRYDIAAAPVKITAVVFLSKESAVRSGAGVAPLLVPLGKSELLSRLRMSQPYAANQPGWSVFSKQVSGLRSFELRRGRHPLEAVDALQSLLGSSRRVVSGRDPESS
jgi:energy-coupling factor transporter ATP-binding protein EcfA2